MQLFLQCGAAEMNNIAESARAVAAKNGHTNIASMIEACKQSDAGGKCKGGCGVSGQGAVGPYFIYPHYYVLTWVRYLRVYRRGIRAGLLLISWRFHVICNAKIFSLHLLWKKQAVN